MPIRSPTTLAVVETRSFDVRYTIEAQRPVEYPGVAGGGDVELLASAMKLDMALLHEEELFRFLDDLRRALSAQVVIRSCTLQRGERGEPERGLAPRLNATCDIDLVTIRDRKMRPA